MPKPNFFVVGAPKCGTTSLAAWLDGHPEACISRPKEPHFFSPNRKPFLHSLADYEACFSHARREHKAVGEASPNTIYARRAVEAMLEYQPRARFVVCVRNPVEMAVSLHNHMHFYGEQRIENFREAWQSEAQLEPVFHERNFRSGEFYRYACALGTHLVALRGIVRQESLQAIFLEDILADEAAALGRLTEFLGIAPSAHPFLRKNPAKQVKSKRLRHFAEGMAGAKAWLGIRKSFKVGGWILRSNVVEGAGASILTPEIHAMLCEYFRPEIAELERLLDRDLSHWLTTDFDTGTA